MRETHYFCYDDRKIPDQFEQTMPEVFPGTAPGNFTWCEEMGKWVLTTFHTYQWDLNYRNPAVFVEMVRSMLLLANLGVEVLRIDAVPYIWKELGTSCRNLHRTAFSHEHAALRHTEGTLQKRIFDGLAQLRALRGESAFFSDSYVSTWDRATMACLRLCALAKRRRLSGCSILRAGKLLCALTRSAEYTPT